MAHTHPDLRLIVITDRDLAAPRDLHDLVTRCLEAGAPAIQLRDKHATARELYEQAAALRILTHRHNALLFINDRLDVAVAAAADGVHLGPHDLPIAEARRAAPPDFLIGGSTDDPDTARRLQAAGADYIGCGTVYPTTTKPDAGTAIGVASLERVAHAVSIPVIAIGGITVERAPEIARTAAAGMAVVRAIMAADDPGAVVQLFLARATAGGGSSAPPGVRVRDGGRSRSGR